MRLASAAAATVMVAAQVAIAEPITIEVWKAPTCGCCGAWVDAMRAEGFAVETTDLDDLRMVRELAGVPRQLGSCHTAMVEGYAIEGHVPAEAIERLLAERPAVTGLSAPGMPQGSPGMSGAPETFDVIAFGAEGTLVWGTYRGAARID